MGFFDRVRNFVTGRGFQESSPVPAPAEQREERTPEPQRQDERGWFERLRDRVTGEDLRREEADRQEQERQVREQERQEQERQRQEIERQRVELERERADLERERLERAEQDRLERQRLEQERQEIERQRAELERQQAERVEQERVERERIEQERQQAERVEQERLEKERVEVERQQAEQRAIDEWRNLGIPDVTGGKDGGAKWTIYGARTPDELRERLNDAAAADRRVSIKVHDKNGWHSLYVNPGRHVGGGAGISASELRDRFDKAGVPGERFIGGGGSSSGGGISPEPGAGIPEMEPDNDIVGEPGNDILDGPEWDYPEEDEEGYPDDSDYYDYIDASDGGDFGDTEGYDPGSVSGYQLVVY